MSDSEHEHVRERTRLKSELIEFLFFTSELSEFTELNEFFFFTSEFTEFTEFTELNDHLRVLVQLRQLRCKKTP
jgi:hypothetical protein